MQSLASIQVGPQRSRTYAGSLTTSCTSLQTEPRYWLAELRCDNTELLPRSSAGPGSSQLLAPLSRCFLPLLSNNSSASRPDTTLTNRKNKSRSNPTRATRQTGRTETCHGDKSTLSQRPIRAPLHSAQGALILADLPSLSLAGYHADMAGCSDTSGTSRVSAATGEVTLLLHCPPLATPTHIGA